jgi:lincosamide nucleotidyltransferase A/C/D/E
VTVADVLWLLGVLEAEGFEVWLEGGWGVDALLNEQTRAHRDADLVVRLSDVPGILHALVERGFVMVAENRPSGFLLKRVEGQAVDVRAVVFDDCGNGIYRTDRGDEWVYLPGDLTGKGTIEGKEVNCISPSAQMSCHTGYTPIDKDYEEVWALRDRFGVEAPPEFARRPTSEGA